MVLNVDKFVRRGGGPLLRKKQDSHVYRKTGTLLAVSVLIVDQFVGRGGCPLERQKQDSHVYGKLAHCQPFLVLTVDQFFWARWFAHLNDKNRIASFIEKLAHC